jgi:hypothetical protein
VAAKLKVNLNNLRELVAGRLLGQHLEIAQLIGVDVHVPKIFLEMDQSSKTRKVRGAPFEVQWIQLHYQSVPCAELLLFLHGPSDRSKDC